MMVKSSEVIIDKLKGQTFNINMISKILHSKSYITLLWYVPKLDLMSLNNNWGPQDSNILMLQLSVMPPKQLWLNFTSRLKTFKKQDLYILMEEQKRINNLKCPLTLQINMLCLLLDNKDLITIMLLISKELLKKFGNIVEEYSMKENIKISIHNKIKNSKMLIWDLVKMVKESLVLGCYP